MPLSVSKSNQKRKRTLVGLLLFPLLVYSSLAHAALNISPSQTSLTKVGVCDPTVQGYINDIILNGSVTATETTPGTGFFKLLYPANANHSLLVGQIGLFTSTGVSVASSTVNTLNAGAGFKSVNKTGIANGIYFLKGIFALSANTAQSCLLQSGNFTVSAIIALTVSAVTPSTGILNQAQNYTVNGSNLPSSLAFTITNATGTGPNGSCGQVSFSSTRVVFNCTPRTAGVQTYTVKSTSGGTVLKTGPVTISSTASTISSVTPSTGTLNQAQNYTVNGSNLPSSLAFTISNATGTGPNGGCGQVSFSPTSVVFNCTPRTLGAQTYTVKNTSGGTVLGTGNVTISNVNYVHQAPVAGAAWTEGNTYNIQWTSGPPGPLNISLIDLASWSVTYNIVTLPTNTGSYTWTIPTNTLPQGSAVRDYQIYIEDSIQSIWQYGPTFQILKAPNQPPAPTASAITTPVGVVATSQVLANDPNLRDTFNYTVTLAAANGTATVNANGLATYTPSTGFSGGDSFTVTVTDNGGLSNTVVVNVTVVNIPNITSLSVADSGVAAAPYAFTALLSGALPAGYYVAINFDNQQGRWFLQTDLGGHFPLNKISPTQYSNNRVLNKPGLRSFQAGIFNANNQLVGTYSNYSTCLLQRCLDTVERNNVVGNPATRGSQTFKNVDVVSGNYHFVSADMSVPGKGVSFSLNRAYNDLGTRSTVAKPLTKNDLFTPKPWSFAHDIQLRFMDDTSDTGLPNPTDRQVVIGPMEDGSLLYYFKDMDQLWYTLTPGDFHELIQNTNGSFSLYSKGNRIYQFANPNGVAKGRLNKMENRLHQGITYTYDINNVLTNAADANNRSYTFTYATGALGHKILQRVDDFSGRSVIYTYDVNEMITQVKNVKGGFERYTYAAATGIGSSRLATIKDPRNTTIPQMSLTYDNGGRVLTLIDGASQTTSFVYGLDNTVGEITGITQPVVDALNHNLVYVLDAKRSKVIQRIDAKSYSQVGFAIAANDIKTTQAYKAATSRTTLADKALVVTTTNPNNNSTSITYDATIGRANPATIVDAKNRTVSAAYVVVANQPNLTPVTSVTQPGVATPTQYQRFTTTGKAQDTIDARSFKTTRAFDVDDQMLTSTNPRLNATHYTYDVNGNVTSITDALGNQTTKTYDLLGRLKTVLSPLGLTTTYTYDVNGNTLTRTETAAGINYVTRYQYDANNNLTQTTDPLNHVTAYTYDNMNRKTQESYSVGGIPHVRSFTYNALGKLATVTDERGFATQTHYTSRNQISYKVDPLLKHTVTYTYDNNGNVTTVKDAENRTVTTTYDALNRKTQTTDSKGNVQKWTYNAAGQVATYTDARLKLTGYLYDAVGNVTQVIDAKNAITKSTYDGNGNVLTVTDPNIHTTSYAYDALDRRISTTLHDGRKWTYNYDANGNMLTEITPTGEKTVKTYDPSNRVASLKEYAANGVTITRSISYTYDANDNVLTEVSGANTIAYTYDEINRITSVIDQYGKTVSYGYDKAGNRTTLTYPGNPTNLTVSYVYDKAGRLNSLKDWLNKTTTYTRNFAGQVTQVLNGNGSKTTYLYDTAGRLTNLTNIDGNAATISSQAMTLDGAGNITNSTMNLPLLPTLPPSTGTMAYDLTNRLTSAGANSYTPDLAGRTITETKGAVQTTYQFDIKDHITSIKQGATTLSSYGYDLKNNRISQIQNGTETRYVIDQLASLPNVIAETNNLGVISTYYIYGEGLVSQITAGGVSHYYHYDPTGNTLALTDAAGNVSDTFAYAPYGFTTSTGLTHNPFKFVGKYGVMDDGNGLHYMRARYYKEDIKRFVSLDALHGDMMTPQKLNRYAYVLGNPVMGVDPSGLSSIYTYYFKNLYKLPSYFQKAVNDEIVQLAKDGADVYVIEPAQNAINACTKDIANETNIGMKALGCISGSTASVLGAGLDAANPVNLISVGLRTPIREIANGDAKFEKELQDVAGLVIGLAQIGKLARNIKNMRSRLIGAKKSITTIMNKINQKGLAASHGRYAYYARKYHEGLLDAITLVQKTMAFNRSQK